MSLRSFGGHSAPLITRTTAKTHPCHKASQNHTIFYKVSQHPHPHPITSPHIYNVPQNTPHYHIISKKHPTITVSQIHPIYHKVSQNNPATKSVTKTLALSQSFIKHTSFHKESQKHPTITKCQEKNAITKSPENLPI